MLSETICDTDYSHNLFYTFPKPVSSAEMHNLLHVCNAWVYWFFMKLDWTHIRVQIESAAAFPELNEADVRKGLWRGWFRHHALWHVRDGEARLHTHAGEERLEAGRLVWFRPGFEYGFPRGLDKPLRLDTMHFCLVEDPRGNHVHALPGVAEVMTPGDPDYVAAVIRRITGFGERIPGQHHRVFRAYRRERAERLLTELLIELAEENPAPRELEDAADPLDLLLLEMGRRIAARPDRGYSVEDLAREAGLSRARFSIRFERVNRKPPRDFIIQQRIALAGQLLAETTLPVGEIGYRCGYSSPCYFSRQFKKWTGLAPRAFRRQGKGIDQQ